MKIDDRVITTLKDNSSFLAHVHLSPDPDSVGSVLALKLALEAEGKLVHVYSEDPLLQSASFLPGFDSIERSSMTNALTRTHDVYLCLDTAKWELASHSSRNEIKQPVVVIDHHPDNSIKSKLRWIEPEASSAAELVYRLLKQLDWRITPEIATCLLFGLLGDTGLFQNTNTKARDFALARELIESGADYHNSVLHQARSYSPTDLASMGKALDSIQLAEDDSFAWMRLTLDDCRQLAGEPKIGFIANMYAGRIDGTKFGAVLAEKERGVTKGSLRSRVPEFDVAAIARSLGGGGHKNAASFKLGLPLAKAEAKFLEAVNNIMHK